MGEVLYFFQIKGALPGTVRTCAMISLTSGFDPQARAETSNVLWICRLARYEKLIVVDIHDIESLVALLPYGTNGEFFLMEDLGSSVASALAGDGEDGDNVD